VVSHVLRGGHTPAMIAEPLAVRPLGAKSVDFPRLAQFAAGASVARAFAFVIHGVA
jgi:hypothetical protein